MCPFDYDIIILLNATGVLAVFWRCVTQLQSWNSIMVKYCVGLIVGKTLSSCHWEKQQGSKHHGISLLTMPVGVQLVTPREDVGVLLRVSAVAATAIVDVLVATSSMRTGKTNVLVKHHFLLPLITVNQRPKVLLKYNQHQLRQASSPLYS